MTSPLLRRCLALAGALAGLAAVSLVLSAPASADTPEGWPTPDPVNPLHALAVGLGIPALIGLVILIAVYAPALARGERVAPGATAPESEWLGGSRKEAGELEAADRDPADSGGAGGSW